MAAPFSTTSKIVQTVALTGLATAILTQCSADIRIHVVVFVVGWWLFCIDWVQAFQSLVLGRARAKTSKSAEDQFSESEARAWNDACPLVGGLPIAQIASFLAPADIGVVSASGVDACHRIWEAPEVWKMLAVKTGLHLTCAADNGETGNLHGARVVRDAFRRAYRHVDGARLRCLPGAACQAILEEAAVVLSGLEPGDEDAGAMPVEEFCQITEQALHRYDPSRLPEARAADRFVDVAQRMALSLMSEAQFERLDFAYRNSVRFHDLLVSSMEERGKQMEQDACEWR